VVADLYAVAPYARATGPREVPGDAGDAGRVPADARELARCHFGPRAGLGFAFLTGDINPVHWLRPFARASGFATPILHGFAMMARAMEGLGRALYAGATDRIRVLDVKFKRPLLLGDGVDVGLYLDHRDPHAFYFAIAPGSRAYMLGRFETREQRSEGANPAINLPTHQPALARTAADHPQPAPSYAVGGAHA
jgi:acyl dehydratase